MDKPTIIQVLEDAQLAHQSGDFVSALKFYQHFFDHALAEDPAAFYGVRLSHCLQGWSRLAQVFPGAKQALERKQQEVLTEYLRNEEPEIFNDYLEISTQLGDRQMAISEFIALFDTKPDTAKRLSRYVWNDLIDLEEWNICNALLTEPTLKLDELFAVYDEFLKMRELDPRFDTLKFEQHIVDQLLLDVQRTVSVLRHQNRAADIAALQRQFFQGIQHRDHALLSKQVNAKGAFLFAAH